MVVMANRAVFSHISAIRKYPLVKLERINSTKRKEVVVLALVRE
jgi:hypothetical protein